jgi:hypothetical protein
MPEAAENEVVLRAANPWFEAGLNRLKPPVVYSETASAVLPATTEIDPERWSGDHSQGDAVVFFVRKYAFGRRHYVTIGENGCEGWTEAKARKAALLAIAAIKQGRDPAAERAKARQIPTLVDFADNFIRQRSSTLKPGTIANYRGLLNSHIWCRPVSGAPASIT